jgi:hypothetical protein
MLLHYALEANLKRTFSARARALRVAFKLVDRTTLDFIASRVRRALLSSKQGSKADEIIDVLRDADFSILQHWQHCMYMEQLQILRIPLTLRQLKDCDKTSLMRSIWKDHHDSRCGLRLLSALMLEFECQSLELWNATMSQMKRMSMIRELLMLLNAHAHFRCFSQLGSSPDDVHTNAVMCNFVDTWVYVLEAPLRELLTMPLQTNVGAIVTVIHGVASTLESCPFLAQLQLNGVRSCTRTLLDRDTEFPQPVIHATKMLEKLCAAIHKSFAY